MLELRPGVLLVAGPLALPARRLLGLVGATGRPVLVVGGDRERGADWLQGPLGADALQAWLDRANDGVLVLCGAGAIGGAYAAERGEDHLARLLAALRMPARSTLVLLEPLPPERLVRPDGPVRRLLGRVDRTLLWTGEILAPAALLWTEGASAPALDRLRKQAHASPWRYRGLAALIVAAAVGMTLGPRLVGNFSGVPLIGDVRDGLSHGLWADWWVWRQLRHGEAPGHTELLFWPFGAEVAPLVGGLGAAWLASPLMAALGFPGFWNVAAGLALLCNGLATIWLSRVLGASRGAALLAGLSFALCPAVLGELAAGHQELFWAAPLPLAIGLGVRALEGGRGRALVFGTALGMAAAVWGFFALMAAGVVAAMAGDRALRDRAARETLVPQLGETLRALAPWSLLALPWLSRAAERGASPLDALETPGSEGPSAAANALFAEITSHSLPLARLLGLPAPDRAWPLSLLALLLPGIWLLAHRGRRLFWPGVIGIAAVLSLGPWLPPTLGLSSSWLPLPLAALQELLPPLRALDRPDGLLLLVGLGESLLLALLWTAWSPRGRPLLRPLEWVAALAALALLPLLGGARTLPLFDYRAPAWIDQLGSEGAILDVPLGWAESAILWQPLHGRPVAAGPDDALAFAEGSPFRTMILADPALAFFFDATAPRLGDEGVQALRREGLGVVVVHTGLADALAAAHPQDERDQTLGLLISRIDLALGPAAWEGDGVRIYRLRSRP